MNIRKTTIYIFILFQLACSGPENEIRDQPIVPDLPGKELNVAFVIVDGVYNSELIAPMDIFHHTIFHVEPGMKVFTVAPDTSVVTSFEGLRIIPDFAFGSRDLPEIDILVVPSAEKSMSDDLNNDELISFVREKGKNADYTISLCDGAFVLARAGLVKGKKSTTFPSDIEAYKQRFPDLEVISDVSFVRDGSLITSAGGAKSYDPALYLCEVLYGREIAIGIGKGLVIDWEPSEIRFQEFVP